MIKHPEGSLSRACGYGSLAIFGRGFDFGDFDDIFQESNVGEIQCSCDHKKIMKENKMTLI